MFPLVQILMSYLYCQKPVLEGKPETVIAPVSQEQRGRGRIEMVKAVGFVAISSQARLS
jgi:hypothetical protein